MEAQMEARPVETAKPKVSWKDFDLEVHLSSWLREQGKPVSADCIIKVNKVYGNTYRVNVYKVVETFSKDDKAGVIMSMMLKITETPEGYVFTDITK